MKALLIGCLLLCGCGTIAPAVVQARFRAIDSRGNPTGGFWGVEKYNGIEGVKVDPDLVVINYAFWYPVYGKMTVPPAREPDEAFVKLPNGDTWCNDITWLNYEDMKDDAKQDAKL